MSDLAKAIMLSFLILSIIMGPLIYVLLYSGHFIWGTCVWVFSGVWLLNTAIKPNIILDVPILINYRGTR